MSAVPPTRQVLQRIALIDDTAQQREALSAFVLFLPPLRCGARGPGARERDYARRFALRRPAIEATQAAIVKQLGFAKSEMLRRIDKHFRGHATPPLTAREYSRDELGRFSPNPFSETARDHVLQTALRTLGLLPNDEIGELYAIQKANAGWRKKLASHQRARDLRIAHATGAMRWSEDAERIYRTQLLAIFRERDRETNALASLAQHVALRRRAALRLPAVSASQSPATDHPSPLQAAEGGGAAADLMFDLDSFTEGLLATLRNESAATLQSAGTQAVEELGADDPFTMPAPQLDDFWGQRENKLKEVPQEMFDRIQAELREGLAKGETMRELEQRITGQFAEMEEGRAAVIASTEVAAAYGYARNEAQREQGVQFKQWLGSGLASMRPAHAEANAARLTVPFDEPFLVDNERLMFPGDPAGSPGNVINCHCMAVAGREENVEEAA